MGHKYQINLISDSTGETLDRIFLALKSQFLNFDYEKKEYVFIRTEQQINKIIEESKKKENVIILYTIVETKLAKYISQTCETKNIPCFGILGNLILNFSKLLNQKAIHVPSAQHILDSDYYKRIEAIQFSMSHDDGMRMDDIKKADIILLGVSRTSKTPTSIYLANKGYKTLNIPLITNQKIPDVLKEESNMFCVIGLTVEANRLSDIRTNRLETMNEINIPNYSNLNFIQAEIKNSKNLFKKYNWPSIDVTRKSVEETAASIIRIFDIKKRQKKMKIILASKSAVRREILEKNNFKCTVVPSNVNEEQVKDSLLAVGANPMLVSKNLAELKSIKVSNKYPDQLVLGADSVISLNNELINKPSTRGEALEILKKLNGSEHYLITSVCISKNGSMIWNFTDKAELTMKQMSTDELRLYLAKIRDEDLYAYNVYQIEGEGRSLFSKTEGDEDTIMGLPIKQIKKYLNTIK